MFLSFWQQFENRTSGGLFLADQQCQNYSCCGAGMSSASTHFLRVNPELPRRCPHQEVTIKRKSTHRQYSIQSLIKYKAARLRSPAMRKSAFFPLKSAVMVVFLAITLLHFTLAEGTLAGRRGGSGFAGQSYQRYRYGSEAHRADIIAQTRNARRMGAVTGISVPKLKRGRKMLFGTLSCAPQDLSLTQGPVSSTSGIPTFDVQIVNLCGLCAMGEIHVACGNWASATPVDPFVFTRLGYNDCLVNNGQPLSSQGSVSFQYSNSAMYPMSITSATNQCHR